MEFVFPYKHLVTTSSSYWMKKVVIFLGLIMQKVLIFEPSTWPYLWPHAVHFFVENHTG